MRTDEKISLCNLPLFRNISGSTSDALLQGAYSQIFPPQLELFRQGQTADFLYIIVEGMVELYAEWNGQTVVMGMVQPVTTFILAACVQDSPYLMSARTIERSRIILLPVGKFREQMRTDSELAMAAMEELALGYRTMVRHAKNLKLRSARERLAAWIISNAQGASTIILPTEKRNIGSFLGVTPESFSRTLRSLQADGVQVDGSRIIITDATKLAAVAAPDPLMDNYYANQKTD